MLRFWVFCMMPKSLSGFCVSKINVGANHSCNLFEEDVMEIKEVTGFEIVTDGVGGGFIFRTFEEAKTFLDKIIADDLLHKKLLKMAKDNHCKFDTGRCLANIFTELVDGLYFTEPDENWGHVNIQNILPYGKHLAMHIEEYGIPKFDDYSTYSRYLNDGKIISFSLAYSANPNNEFVGTKRFNFILEADKIFPGLNSNLEEIKKLLLDKGLIDSAWKNEETAE